MAKRAYIETYGCQMNVNDTEVIFAILADAGYERAEKMEEADLIMANTCSIRDNAEQRIWGRLEVFSAQRKARPGVLVGIVGCMAERLKDKLLDTGKVDLVVGPDAYRSLPRLLEAVSPSSPQIDVLLSREETYADITPVRTDRNGISAFISIMRGCNNVCSYCVVPYTRGAERSRDAHSIVREACDVYSRGYKEVTLLGQNVDSYLWKGPGETVNFARLLEMVAAVAPDLRVRFATSHPKDISDEVIHTMAVHPNICRHIHLPVQSGSTRMLELMRRKYSREWYLERVAKIREVMPDCGLTTDVIAGFCSETEEDHLETLSLMEAVGFDWAFMFAYSDRPGTLANRTMKDDVPTEVKNRRLQEIIDLQNRKSLERYKAMIGRQVQVLVEGPSKRDPAQLCGRASNNMMCVFPAAGLKPGDFTTVTVQDATSATLICR
ncbi:MAG: tRNA (N6-isopentenyl adenosine(37)-C2)-methylthiotransferase MiaB [Bacteroidales bacterium]|nr:tRNA (N6-isopentenyl adenosine(37)-C2)-methylthiotransferase MiaB [Bacteroidales bacterium]